MTDFDAYHPFEDGPGMFSTMTRWRRMARLWGQLDPAGQGELGGLCSGVVRAEYGPTPGEPNPLLAYQRDGLSISLTAGAVWVNGFYGFNRNWTALPTPGPVDGLVVARFDPAAQEVALVWRGGATDPVLDPEGWWEVPLAYVDAGGVIHDRRTFVPKRRAPARLHRADLGALRPARSDRPRAALSSWSCPPAPSPSCRRPWPCPPAVPTG